MGDTQGVERGTASTKRSEESGGRCGKSKRKKGISRPLSCEAVFGGDSAIGAADRGDGETAGKRTVSRVAEIRREGVEAPGYSGDRTLRKGFEAHAERRPGP